jgi:hypothetical protein
MSVLTPQPPWAGDGKPGSARIPAGSLLGFRAGAAAFAAVGLFLAPGQARADDYSSGHAEISLGFPHGSITLGKTWDNRPDEVVVERVTHKLPEVDYDDEEEEGYSAGPADEGDVAYEDDADEIIVEKRAAPRPKKIVIIERYEEPVQVEHVSVVRKVYVDPCPPAEVVVYRPGPRRVVHRHSRRVIHGSSVHVNIHAGGGHRHFRGHGKGHHVSRGHHAPRGHHVSRGHSHGSRNLYPVDNGRPMRSRGRQGAMVRVGGHPH